MPRSQEEIDKELDKIIQQAEKKSTKIFAKQLKNILAEISDMYAKYETDGELSLAEMSKFNRLQNLYESISRHLIKGFDEAYILVDETRKQVYLQQYFQSAYVYEMATQLKMGFGALDPHVVEIAIENPIPKLKLPQIMERNRNEIIAKIQEEIARGLAAGDSYAQMARRIRKELGFSEYKARTIARTEAGKSQSKARLDAEEKANQFVSTDRKWIATHDLRTRHSHRELDGQLAGKDGQFEYHGYKAPAPRLFTKASLTINCRCSYLAVIDGEIPKVRRARNYQDQDYREKLEERIDHYVAKGYTERQAGIQARKEVMPPSMVTKYQDYNKWYADNIGA